MTWWFARYITWYELDIICTCFCLNYTELILYRDLILELDKNKPRLKHLYRDLSLELDNNKPRYKVFINMSGVVFWLLVMRALIEVSQHWKAFILFKTVLLSPFSKPIICQELIFLLALFSYHLNKNEYTHSNNSKIYRIIISVIFLNVNYVTRII